MFKTSQRVNRYLLPHKTQSTKHKSHPNSNVLPQKTRVHRSPIKNVEYYTADLHLNGKLQTRPDKDQSKRYNSQVNISREELEQVSSNPLFRDVRDVRVTRDIQERPTLR